jgi:hypothetical protein
MYLKKKCFYTNALQVKSASLGEHIAVRDSDVVLSVEVYHNSRKWVKVYHFQNKQLLGFVCWLYLVQQVKFIYRKKNHVSTYNLSAIDVYVKFFVDSRIFGPRTTKVD